MRMKGAHFPFWTCECGVLNMLPLDRKKCWKCKRPK